MGLVGSFKKRVSITKLIEVESSIVELIDLNMSKLF